MSTINTVLKHINNPIKGLGKTELTNQKVELGIVDDLNKIDNSSQSIIKEVKDRNVILDKQKKLLEKGLQDIKKDAGKADKLRDKFFDLENKYESAKQESNRADKELESTSKSYENTKSSVKTLEKKNEPKIKEARKNIGLLEKLIGNAEKMAKELGVKIPINQYVKTLQNLRKLL
jgi:chromosome segregation ATPase|tara:strand:+ start:356 stop:883 length:528 start_codon:yes stop_codon:yes gene_type:complete